MPIIGQIKKGKELGFKNSNKHIWLICPNCGEGRWVQLVKGKAISSLCRSCAMQTDEFRMKMHTANIGRHPSDETRAKMRISHSGEKGHAWKGGRIGDGHGYIYIWVKPDDSFFPMCAGVRGVFGGYVREHRLIVARTLGRCLRKGEIVHHLNGIRDDNRRENLALVSVNSHPKKTFVKQLQTRIRELEQLHLAIG